MAHGDQSPGSVPDTTLSREEHSIASASIGLQTRLASVRPAEKKTGKDESRPGVPRRLASRHSSGQRPPRLRIMFYASCKCRATISENRASAKARHSET